MSRQTKPTVAQASANTMNTHTRTVSSLINEASPISIVHLYPFDMDVNGDYGNMIALLKRMEWRGIAYRHVRHSAGDRLPSNPDLFFGGGSEIAKKSDVHSAVQADLLTLKEQLCSDMESGAAFLLLGGSFQLFGHSIKTLDGEDIEGLGLFDMHTVVQGERHVGNVMAQSETFGQIVGFENHVGKTYLSERAKPLAQVVQGQGNNGNIQNNEGSGGGNASCYRSDSSEGVHYRHAIGSNLFGPLLPKNPVLADYLIAKAIEHHLGRRLQPDELEPLTQVDNCAALARRL